MRTNDPGRPLSREIKQAASANVSTFAREWRFRAMAFINRKRSSVLAERRRYEADVRSDGPFVPMTSDSRHHWHIGIRRSTCL
jgi:hypothetical protein